MFRLSWLAIGVFDEVVREAEGIHIEGDGCRAVAIVGDIVSGEEEGFAGPDATGAFPTRPSNGSGRETSEPLSNCSADWELVRTGGRGRGEGVPEWKSNANQDRVRDLKFGSDEN